MTADQYNIPSFGEGLNFSETWLDLPPQFMGSTTSFGQQPGPSLVSPPEQGLPNHFVDFHGSMSLGSSLMPPPPPPPPHHLQHHTEHGHTPDDVLNAAATLLQNGSNQRQASNGGGASFSRKSIGPPVGHLRHQPLEEFREDHRRNVVANEQDSFPDWMYSPQQRRRLRAPPPSEYQWGSDANFDRIQGFTPNSDKETAESLSKEQLKHLECFQHRQSADNTRSNSPNFSQMAPLSHDRMTELSKVQQEVNAPPRKRRKSKNGKENPEDENKEEMTIPKSATRRRKTKVERVGSTASAATEETSVGKRRKSGVSAAKTARENLSEEQKRENHIRSEQKRRTLIKEGFDDLCDLVPGLKGGGFSKSTMLAMTADWLDEIIKGNEILNEQLAALEGR